MEMAPDPAVKAFQSSTRGPVASALLAPWLDRRILLISYHGGGGRYKGFTAERTDRERKEEVGGREKRKRRKTMRQ